jgi:LysR family glycine cleavage system transcriptional activator
MIPNNVRDPGSPIDKGRLPSLTGLRCFEIAARTESFSRAADELHLTHGAVSRAVRQLEDELGVPLFERRNRAVFLTDAGRRLAETVTEAFAGIRRATRAIRSARDRSVTIACEPSLLMRWLIPRLSEFECAHPGVQLRLIAARPGALDDDADLSIRRDDVAQPDGWYVKALFAEEVGPVCAPHRVADFFDLDAEPSRLRADAPLLHTHTRPMAWDDWISRRDVVTIPGVEQWFEHFYFSLQAASAGLGVAIGPYRLVEGDLAAGLLAAPLGFSRDGSNYNLLSPIAFDTNSSLLTVAEWLRKAGECSA